MKHYTFLTNNNLNTFYFDFSNEKYSEYSKFWKVFPRLCVYFLPFLYRLVRSVQKEKEFDDFVKAFDNVLPKNNDEDRIHAIIDMCRRNTTYVTDKKLHGLPDYWATAIETLYRGVGDCDDYSILMCSILHKLGYDCIFIVMKDHLSVGVSGNFSGEYLMHHGKKYYYVDSTSRTDIGVIPKSHKDKFKICFRGH